MRVSSCILRNAVTGWVAQAVRGGIAFLLVPFLLYKFGKEGYGLIALVGAIIVFTELADLGLRGAMSRHLAERVAIKNVQQANELLSSGTAAYFVCGAALATGLALSAPYLAKAFNVSETYLTEAVLLIRWYGSASVFLSFIAPIYSATLASNNRFDIINYVSMATGILRGIVLFVILGLTNAGLYGWAGATFGVQVLMLIVIRTLAHNIYPDMRISYRYVSGSAFRALFSLGGYMLALRVANLLAIESNPIILTICLGPAAVALYVPAIRLCGLVRPTVSTLANQLAPLATGYYATDKMEKLRKTLIRGTRYTFLMGIVFCVFFAVFAKPIIGVWLGKSLGADYPITAWVLGLCATCDLLLYSANVEWPILVAMNRLRFLLWLNLPFAVLNIMASFALVRYTSVGVVGVMIPTVVSLTVRVPIIMVYTCRLCKLSVKRFFVEAYLRPIFVLLILLLVALNLRQLIEPDSLLNLVYCVIIVGVLWIAACWWVGFRIEDRDSFRSRFPKIGNLAKSRLKARNASKVGGYAE